MHAEQGPGMRGHLATAAALTVLCVCAAVALSGMSVLLIGPTGGQAGEQFGYAVASGGDINGDGFEDAVVGAPLFDSSAVVDRGRVIVYYGGAAPDHAADLILVGFFASDHFGWSVAVGNVNNDGFDDIIVGAPLNDDFGVNAGRAYVYFGGNPPNNFVGVYLTPGAAGDNFGWSVSCGDVTGDGFDDVLVGAPLADVGVARPPSAAAVADVGRAFRFNGAASMDGNADLTLDGELAGDHFGWSVAFAEDLNGDLLGDIVVGAPTNDPGTTDAGKGYVYFGDTAPLGPPNITYTSPTPTLGGNFGWSVAGAGTFSGDGLGDVIVGAPREDPAAGADAGKAYMFYGVNPGPPDLTLTGAAGGDNFGHAVALAGDVDASGRTDVIVGSPLNDAVGLSSGRADLYLGGGAADAVTDAILLGEAAGDQFGFTVGTAGRFNGDPGDAVVVGAPLHNPTAGADAGRVYIFSITFSVERVAAPAVSPIATITIVVVLGVILFDVSRRRSRARLAS